MNILGISIAALLNSLWQSLAIALLAWGILRLLPSVKIGINAATRCAVWWAVLCAVLLLPMAPQHINVPERPSAAAPASSQSAVIPMPSEPAIVTSSEASPSRSGGPLQMTAGAGLAVIFAIWSVLSLFRFIQIVRSYRYLRGVKQRSRSVSPEQLVNFSYWLLACQIDRTARMLVSSEIVSPMAVGFRRPAVIVPETLLNEFTPAELDHVVLHELAHIARYDDWTNLFARLIGALLPIHPVAVWLIKTIDQEREAACDDWVVAMTGEARPYAASLTRLFELCSARRRQQLLATGMAGRASHLGERIESLLRSGRDFAPRVSLVRVGLGAIILVGLVFAGAQAPQWVAFAQQPAFAQGPAAPAVPPAPAVPARPAAPAAPPIAPTPVEPAIPPSPALPALAAQDLDDLQNDLEARQKEVQRLVQQLDQLQRELAQRKNTYTPAHPEIVALEARIRAAQAEIQAGKAQIQSRSGDIRAGEADQRAHEQQLLAMQAAQVAQNEQRRLDAQIRGSGQGGSFLAAVVAAGYGNLSVDEIIEMRDSGVSPEFLRSLAESGLKPSAKEVIELARSGVSGQYLRGLRDGGFKNLGIPDIIEAARSGVRPDLVRALKDAFPQITMREIIEAAHSGLNAGDLRQAREFSPNLTFPQVIKLKQAGVI